MSSTIEPIQNPGEFNSENSLTLVEIEDGVAAVLGNQPLESFDLTSFEVLSDQRSLGLIHQASIAAGAVNLLAQGAQGAMSVQGLVRLSPGTVRALKTAQPITRNGWNLGVLKGANGQIVQHIQWAPATAAKATQILASLGPAAALLALQAQLASISRQVEKNIELTHRVLRALYEDQWATLMGLHEATLRAAREAQVMGTVSDHIFTSISSKEAELNKQRRLFSGKVHQHALALADEKKRRAYVMDNMELIEADACALLMAESSWLRAQVLRIGNIAHDKANAAENGPLLDMLTANVRHEHKEAMETATSLLGSLEQQCNLIAELRTKRTFRFGSDKSDANRAVATAKELAARIAQLLNRPPASPEPPEPAITGFDGGAPAEALRVLRWVVPDGEPLLALAEVENSEQLIGGKSYLGITPERFFLTRQSTLHSEGLLEHSTPLDDIRYVRFRTEHNKTPQLDIITKDENIGLFLGSWATPGREHDAARRLANLLSAAMNLPADEMCTDPLLTGTRLLLDAPSSEEPPPVPYRPARALISEE